MQLIDIIENYINRLKTEYGLAISLHPLANEVFIHGSRLIKYNFHNTFYCTHLKLNTDFHGVCIYKQTKIHEKLLRVPYFTGVCHAGVKERVYGLYENTTPLGFISVSGYKADSQLAAPRVAFIAQKFGFSRKKLDELYSALTEEMHEEKLLDDLILPLCKMLEYGNALVKNHASSESLYTNILRHITSNFTENITVRTLSEQFFVSPSHISHTFKKNSGKSIREYLCFLRIEYAKNLLVYTNSSVTEIAFACGFSDCSYFCNQFKKATGKKPNEYRNISN